VPAEQLSVAGRLQVPPLSFQPEGHGACAGSVHCPPFRLPWLQVSGAVQSPDEESGPLNPLGHVVTSGPKQPSESEEL
jgi:hypothetical protein